MIFEVLQVNDTGTCGHEVWDTETARNNTISQDMQCFTIERQPATHENIENDSQTLYIEFKRHNVKQDKKARPFYERCCQY